jgi:hypothetical protein
MYAPPSSAKLSDMDQVVTLATAIIVMIVQWETWSRFLHLTHQLKSIYHPKIGPSEQDNPEIEQNRQDSPEIEPIGQDAPGTEKSEILSPRLEKDEQDFPEIEQSGQDSHVPPVAVDSGP